MKADQSSGAFAVWFGELSYWEARALRLSLTNRCNWLTVPLGKICNVRFEIVPLSEIQSGQVEMLDRISFDEGQVFSGRRTTTKMVQYLAKPGDIVVSKINARKKAIGIVPDGPDVGVTIHFRALIAHPSEVDTQFLWLALRAPFCTNQFDVETGGVGKGEISEERLLSIQVPFPSLDVQRAIVARWQQAQAEIAAANERVKQLEADIDARFFSDLGLTPPAQAERPKVFTVTWKDFTRWSVSYNQSAQAGMDITQGKYPVVQLGSILERVQYGTSEKANIAKKGTPVIRMNNIVDGTLDLSDLKHIRLPENERDRLLLQEGDILFNRTNSKELVGKCAVFHTEGNYIFASYLIRVRADTAKAQPDFLGYIINSPIGRQQIDALSRQIIGQANINSEELRSLQIPLPPIEVQRDIVRRVEAGRAEIARERESAERWAREAEAEVEALILGTKSI